MHHAADASSYSWRAMSAARALLAMTPEHIVNSHTTGSQPRGYTCLHFASDGSDKNYERKYLVQDLVLKKADIESQCAKGNTPYLLAAGVGVDCIVRQLLDMRANPHAVNNRGQGAKQKGSKSSGTVRETLTRAHVPDPRVWVPSQRQREGESESRQMRHMRNPTWK